MPTIITRGLGYDNPTVVSQRIGDRIAACIVVRDQVCGAVEPEEIPVADISTEVQSVQAAISTTDTVGALLELSQQIHATIVEEGPCMVNEDYHIRMFKGDDRDIEATLSWLNGDPVDLTNAEIRFTVKERTSDSQADAPIKKANQQAGGSDAEIKVINASGGRCDIYLIQSDTEDMNAGTYYWDIELVLATGKKVTALRSRITLKDGVTTVA